MTKTQAQWRMSEFCDDVKSRTRSEQSLPELGHEESSEEIFHFLARYVKETFKWNRVLALHQQKITALVCALHVCRIYITQLNGILFLCIGK